MTRPRIVVLERIHDAGLDGLAEFTDIELALGLSRSDILAATEAADGVVVRSVVRVDRELMDRARSLRVIGRAGTGMDNIDIDYARARGVEVIATPGANAETTADFTVAQILCLARNLYAARDRVRAGDLGRHGLEGRELSCLTVGVVGFGRVGRAVAKRLSAFGCRVVGYDPVPAATADFDGVERLESVDAVVSCADVLTLHTDLNPTSCRLIDGRMLGLARPGLLLVNASRANVIDDEALLNALDTGRVAWVAIDVVDPEPDYDAPPGTAFDHPLARHPRVIFTPHMAASTIDAQARIGVQLVAGIRRAFRQ